MPKATRMFLLRAMEAYDGVVVSTRRDLEGLSNAGYRGDVRQVYPHTDPGAARPPAPAAARQLEDLLGLGPDDRVILCVARMDPVKRQDLAIAALRSVVGKHRDAHLVLVGNGSFSGTGHGLGLTKAEQWRGRLEDETGRLGLEDHVHFTGWVPDDLVGAAYARADAVVLPSDLEGFGLTPFEGWAHGKPCIVSSGCGVAEVVQHGLTGLVFEPRSQEGLAECLERVLAHRDDAERMGEAGRIALDSFGPARAADAEASLLEEAVASYGRLA
jgi:glycosyltransferase involved in cell wall biosynthesis